MYSDYSKYANGPCVCKTRRERKSECCQDSHRKPKGAGPAVAFIVESYQNASPHLPSLWENKAVTATNEMRNEGPLCVSDFRYNTQCIGNQHEAAIVGRDFKSAICSSE